MQVEETYEQEDAIVEDIVRCVRCGSSCDVGETYKVAGWAFCAGCIQGEIDQIVSLLDCASDHFGGDGIAPDPS